MPLFLKNNVRSGYLFLRGALPCRLPDALLLGHSQEAEGPGAGPDAGREHGAAPAHGPPSLLRPRLQRPGVRVERPQVERGHRGLHVRGALLGARQRGRSLRQRHARLRAPLRRATPTPVARLARALGGLPPAPLARPRHAHARRQRGEPLPRLAHVLA